MKIWTSDRGFIFVLHPARKDNHEVRVVSESSAVGPYDDAIDNPGSSYLWCGESCHLSREEVAQLVGCLQHWLTHKRLPLELP